MIPKTNRYLNDQGEFIVRASSLGDIMASPKETKLSAGAITFVKNAFRETYWGYEPDFQSDAMSKGVICEPISIELLSRYYNEPYEKNEETRSNGFVKGTCDIAFENKIRDVKTSASKKSFPLLPEDARNTKYEWQGRAYMMLWDKEEFYLDYVLVDTPDSLIPKWESPDLHKGCDDLPDEMRVTTISFIRDLSKEMQIINRVKGCRILWNELKKHYKIK